MTWANDFGFEVRSQLKVVKAPLIFTVSVPPPILENP